MRPKKTPQRGNTERKHGEQKDSERKLTERRVVKQVEWKVPRDCEGKKRQKTEIAVQTT